MEIWLALTLIISMLKPTLHLQVDSHCELHSSVLDGKQLTCTDVNSTYFVEFNIALNRTHWLKCENCTLITLNESTFNIPSRNNISFLELTHSKIRVLQKFAFSKFPLLKFLNLRNNSIDTVDRMCFSGIKKLIHLDLGGNFIKYLTNNVFMELENLDVLNLNKNQIFRIQPEAFSGLIHLKHLYLNLNYLNKLEEDMFKHLSSLKILYLENNNITEIHSNSFVSLRNLNFLYLNNNSISFLVQYNFKGLNSLLDLQLRNNRLKEVQTSSFNGLTNIKSLYLGDNEISVVKPYGFIGLDTLEILELVRNKFVYINYFEYFSHMVNLRYLWLRKNNINNFTLHYEYEVQNSLTVLDLEHNNLTSFNYQLLYNYMPNIKEVFVANNSWRCDFFIYMYNFFEEKNVSVCSSDNCDSNFTRMYIDDICRTLFNNEETFEESSDFSTDCASSINGDVLCFVSMILICIVYHKCLNINIIDSFILLHVR